MNLKVQWFRHTHENRNDLLRFGFMRMHYRGEIEYIEKEIGDAAGFGFSDAVINYPDPRHLSFIGVQSGKSKVRCIVDNEDSFALISPLLTEADVYFCAGYNSDFFEKKQFVNCYSWQDEIDVKGYRELIEQKIERLGSHFNKIKRFIPIAPNQGASPAIGGIRQKAENIKHRIRRATGKGADFSAAYQAFEDRQLFLATLRDEQMAYDVVLNDSLWGWPQHRINLHKQLQELHHRGYQIHSKLNWNPPVDIDGSSVKNIDPTGFPIITSLISDNYEKMLAQSRLAVFACGFHWGWRNIMMLALQAGIPVLTDRLLTEPYFSMDEFKIFQQEDHDWRSVEDILKHIDRETWLSYKEHNQKVYDRYMLPEKVAHYFLTTAFSD